MNELDERNCNNRIAKARFEERANSITRVVIVCLFIAGTIMHSRIYGWAFALGLAIHLTRIFIDQEAVKKKAHLVLVGLEIVFVIVGSFLLMNTFMS